MQLHEGPPEKPKFDKTTIRLVFVIMILLGLIVGQLLKRLV